MAAPYAVSLDPDQARQLATQGAALLLLDVPAGTLLGLDQQVFVVGPRFKGVKMVPPGVHFLSCQATGGDGRVAPAVGTFLALKPRDVVVRRWDAADEGLKPLEDEDEAARYAEGVRRFDFDASLAPYDLASCGAWHDLTCFIDEALLQRVMPVGGEISVMGEALDPELAAPQTDAERRLVAQLQEGRALQQQRLAAVREASTAMDTGTAAEARSGGEASSSQPAGQADGSGAAAAAPSRWGRCFYTRLPRLVKAPGAQGAALTALNLDKTPVLEQVATGLGDPTGKPLLGELQFSFIAFMFGQSLEGFLQWKALVGLFLGCERGPLHSHTPLLVAFLAAVRQQLAVGLRQGAQQQSGGGGQSEEEREGAQTGGPCSLGLPLVEELLPDSFLRRQFGSFFEMLHDSGAEVPAPLAQQARLLEALLRERLGWDYRVQQLGSHGGGEGDGGSKGEGDEDGPVVVELTEEERRMAGLDL